jgi:hypothetical protein
MVPLPRRPRCTGGAVRCSHGVCASLDHVHAPFVRYPFSLLHVRPKSGSMGSPGFRRAQPQETPQHPAVRGVQLHLDPTGGSAGCSHLNPAKELPGAGARQASEGLYLANSRGHACLPGRGAMQEATLGVMLMKHECASLARASASAIQQWAGRGQGLIAGPAHRQPLHCPRAQGRQGECKQEAGRAGAEGRAGRPFRGQGSGAGCVAAVRSFICLSLGAEDRRGGVPRMAMGAGPPQALAPKSACAAWGVSGRAARRQGLATGRPPARKVGRPPPLPPGWSRTHQARMRARLPLPRGDMA